jgi:hypothetical protein
MPFYSTYILLRLCLFRFEQHITKMLPITAYTLFQLSSQISSACFTMFSGIAQICFRSAILRSSMVHGVVVYNFALRSPQRKYPQAGRSCERAGHGSSPRSELTCSGNISRMNSMGSCTILLELYHRELNSTTTQFWCEEVSQHFNTTSQCDCNCTRIFVFEEIRAYDSEVCHSTTNSQTRTVKRPLMELLWNFLSNSENSVCGSVSSDKIPIKRSATLLRFAMSLSLNSCTTTILYGRNFRSLCKILLKLRSDIPRATEYLLAEGLGLLTNDCLTASMFFGDCTVRILPGVFYAEALVPSFLPMTL